MRKITLNIVFVFLIASCGEIDFMLKESAQKNIFKNKTFVVFSGDQNNDFNQEIFNVLGKSIEKEFVLNTKFKEKKENRVVKKNQVAEKIDYEINVVYELVSEAKGCKIFDYTVVTRFSFVPKSFGYNFATDRSFEKLYKESIRKNIQNFIRSAPKNSPFVCL